MHQHLEKAGRLIPIQRVVIVLFQIFTQNIHFSEVDVLHDLKNNRVKVGRDFCIADKNRIRIRIIINTDTVC